MRFWSWLKDRWTKSPAFRMRILIVCRANITRSPYIEALVRKQIQERYPEVADEVGVASAGVEGFRHAGPDPIMRFLAGQREIDLTYHVSQPVSHRLIEQADLILTLEEWHTRNLLERFRDSEGKVFTLPKFGTSDLERQEWDITDPTGKEAERYEEFADLAEQEVERVLDLLEGQLLGARRNLVLIGLPGAGKSTLGKAVAEALEWDFMDTDDRIETAESSSLQTLVDEQGYMALRSAEERVLREISCEQTVIATGGSAVYSESAMTHLRQLGTLIWLDVDTKTLLERIGTGEGRGLAKPKDQSVQELIEERKDLYPRWAERRIQTSESMEEVVHQLVTSITPGEKPMGKANGTAGD